MSDDRTGRGGEWPGRCVKVRAVVGSLSVALWDDEMEALRPQLREEAAAFVASFPWQETGTTTLSLEERIAASRAAQLGGAPSDRAVDRTIEGPTGPLRLRTFAPEKPDGVLFHIHGGAWMAGSAEMMDPLHEVIVDACNVAVVSVSYRLAPEDPYPAGPDDCEAAAGWLLDHAADQFGSDRLLIAGESAGAHLAAVTLLRMRDRHQAADRFLGANLMFGAYDLSRTPSQRGRGDRTRNRHPRRHRLPPRPLPARDVRGAAPRSGRFAALRGPARHAAGGLLSGHQ